MVMNTLHHCFVTNDNSGSEQLGATLDKLLSLSISVNLYMFHGGSNFGLSSGASDYKTIFTPQSYDYDAPLSEPGKTFTVSLSLPVMSRALFQLLRNWESPWTSCSH